MVDKVAGKGLSNGTIIVNTKLRQWKGTHRELFIILYDTLFFFNYPTKESESAVEKLKLKWWTLRWRIG